MFLIVGCGFFITLHPVKEQLCKHILTDKSLSSLAYNLVGNKKKDLLQELGLIICEMDDQQRNKIEGYFNFWCVRTMINMTSPRGNFTKLYSPKLLNQEAVNFDRLDEYDYTIDELIEKVESALDEIASEQRRGWYKKELFKLYLQHGSFRKVEKDVGINYLSVFNTVKGLKNEIKEKL